MSEPLKPRIDFAEPLKEESTSTFKAQQTSAKWSRVHFRLRLSMSILKMKEQQKRQSMLRCNPSVVCGVKWYWGGLALFGASVVGQGIQWTMNAWQTQDWAALGGCAAGALIIGAGVGSVITEWRRLWRLRPTGA
ncbi:Membrane protein YcjF [Salmonella enterica subsp. arizonae]|uniref:Membrane protein YcjF n=1 Tax=Salmonella enterica subsp. arizonae TaxID=59203 RepID=A0A379SJE7_SALER|nr:Membrane protein YcjF [Salmonella enterica subsp. arizonae]